MRPTGRFHPIHAAAAEHKRLLFKHIAKMVRQAGACGSERPVRQSMQLKEGSIVTTHLGHRENHMGDAKGAARPLLENVVGELRSRWQIG